MGRNHEPAKQTGSSQGSRKETKRKKIDIAEKKGHIILPCADGYIDVLELQLPGKKRMDASALLNGIKNKS